MFLPISDMPNPRGTPVINYLLIGLNVAVYLIFTLPLSMTLPNPNDPAFLEYVRAIPQYWNIPITQLIRHITAYDLFIFSHGFKSAHPALDDLFFSMFLHAGFWHLAGNMLFLWIYGDNVEHRLGSFNYLVVYLLTGTAATLFYSLFRLNSLIPMIGASGAISGVLGLYFLWFPRNKVRVFVMLFPLFMDTVLLPARLVLGFFLVVDNLLPFLFASGRGGGVAHGAHIGGFLAGLLIAYGMDRFPEFFSQFKWRSAWRFPSNDSIPDAVEGEAPIDIRVHEAVVRGDFRKAVSEYFSVSSGSARRSLMASDRIQIGYFLLREGYYAEALSVFRHYIADHPSGGFLDRACLGAGVALYEGLGQLTSAYQYFLAVLDVGPEPEVEQEARRYLEKIEAMQKIQIRKKE